MFFVKGFLLGIKLQEETPSELVFVLMIMCVIKFQCGSEAIRFGVVARFITACVQCL